MSTALVRTDRVSGYQWVDFYRDQGARWNPLFTWWPGEANVGSPTDLTDYDARFVVIRLGISTPALELTTDLQGGITHEGSSLAFDQSAGAMADLTHPVYSHEFTLIPDGDEDEAFCWFKGNLILRAMAEDPTLASA